MSAADTTRAQGERGDVTELRLALHRDGYHPVPVSSPDLPIPDAGKRPLMNGWETACATADENEIRRWSGAYRTCSNTGILTGEIVGVDIDVLVPALADKIEALTREVLGSTLLKRIGLVPKRLLVFRAAAPFAKIQTPEFFLPDSTKLQVEVLATGQQFVGFGIHPVTRDDYFWPDKSPLEVPAAELPEITRDMCAELVRRAERLLRAAGGETTAERRKFDERGRAAAGLGRHDKPSREIVLEALNFVPNNELSYDEWIKVGFALYSALGPDGRDVQTIVLDHKASEISAKTMTNAVKLAEWYVNEALRLCRAGRMDPRLRRAQQLLEWLRKQPPEEAVDFRDILRLGPSALRTKAAADDAVRLLIDHHWIDEEEPARPRRVRLRHDDTTQ